MAGHYGTTVCPARPRKPRDKAKVEQSVLLVERWVLARMRNRRFFSLAELNAAVTALHNARVSTEDQRLDLQRARLTEAGCGRLFEEKISGAARQRPALEQLLRELRPDDLLVVTRLDRLARSTSELLRVAEAIREKGAGLQSLEEPWADTTTPAGRMVLTMFAGVAEFERALIRHRTDEGRQAAKGRGVSFGRPQKLVKSLAIVPP